MILFSYVVIGLLHAAPVYDIPDQMQIRFHLNDGLFSSWAISNFLLSNSENTICKVVTNQKSQKKVEQVFTTPVTDLSITSITYSRLVIPPYRQLLKLVYRDGWIDCRFNKKSPITRQDVVNSFQSAEVQIISPASTSSLAGQMDRLHVKTFEVDANSQLATTNCFLTAYQSQKAKETLQVHSYYYSSELQKLGITYSSPDETAMLHCEDQIEDVSKALADLVI